MSFSDASNVASLGNLALGGPGLGPAGIGLGFASSMLGGKGGKHINPQPGGTPGNYTLGGKPWNGLDSYQIQGNNGMYNLLPALGQHQNRAWFENSMKNDPLALQLFNQRFPVEQQKQLSGFANMGRMGGIGQPAPQYKPNLGIGGGHFIGGYGNDPLSANARMQSQANKAPSMFAVYANDNKHPYFTPK